jgi:hypothetical protein
MDSSYIWLVSALISILYFVIKVLESKYVNKEDPDSLKSIVKNSIIVSLSSVSVMYISKNYLLNFQNGKQPIVFLDNPNF